MCLALLVSLNMCLRQQQLESLYKPLRYVTWLSQSSECKTLVVARFNSYVPIATFSGSQPSDRFRSGARFFGVTNAWTTCTWSLIHPDSMLDLIFLLAIYKKICKKKCVGMLAHSEFCCRFLPERAIAGIPRCNERHERWLSEKPKKGQFSSFLLQGCRLNTGIIKSHSKTRNCDRYDHQYN